MSLSGPHSRKRKYGHVSAGFTNKHKYIYFKYKLTVALHRFKVVKFQPVLILSTRDIMRVRNHQECYIVERSNYYEQIFLSGEGDRIP